MMDQVYSDLTMHLVGKTLFETLIVFLDFCVFLRHVGIAFACEWIPGLCSSEEWKGLDRCSAAVAGSDDEDEDDESPQT